EVIRLLGGSGILWIRRWLSAIEVDAGAAIKGEFIVCRFEVLLSLGDFSRHLFVGNLRRFLAAAHQPRGGGQGDERNNDGFLEAGANHGCRNQGCVHQRSPGEEARGAEAKGAVKGPPALPSGGTTIVPISSGEVKEACGSLTAEPRR